MTPSPTTIPEYRAAWLDAVRRQTDAEATCAASRQAETDALVRLGIVQASCDRYVRALEFYGRAENWREGTGTGPRRAAPCVADSGREARQALDPAGMSVGGGL